MTNEVNANPLFSIHKNFSFKYQRQNENSWTLSLNPGLRENHLELKKGFIAIMGESGSGKSTFMSILSGFEKLSQEQKKNIKYFQDTKEIHYDSKFFRDCRKKNFGYIFQRCYESKPLSAKDNIALPLFIKNNQSKKSIYEYSEKLLASLNMKKLEASPANELSGGQLTRIGILRGIAQTPHVIFADEPANNLDSQNAQRILEILKRWREEKNGAVIMVTHHVEHAFKYADQIVLFKSKENNHGEIIFNKCKKENLWTDQEKQEIRSLLKKDMPFDKEFPDPLKTNNKQYLNYLPFLSKISLKNITSKADGSRAISMITLSAFLLLFFLIFAGNQMIDWFSTIDKLKNNSSFLRQFDIQVTHPPGLSTYVQNTINQVTAGTVQQWLITKLSESIQHVDKTANQIHIKSPIEFICQSNTANCAKSLLNGNSFHHVTKKRNALIINFRNYGYYASNLIHTKASSENLNIKQLKLIERGTREINRLLSFLVDISSFESNTVLASTYRSWESGPEFVKKNGQRMNRTTTIKWIDYRDLFFEDPRFKFIVNGDFRFTSNDDQGIIIDKETLVDDLGYDLKANEVRILYGSGEKACIPIRAVVERMPESGKYHAITTFGFGEKIRSSSQHCDENKQFYQTRLTVSENIDFNERWKVIEPKNNQDRYGNLIINYTIMRNKTIDLYSDYKYAKTKSQWREWVHNNLILDHNAYQMSFDDKWEVFEKNIEDPPIVIGTVYTKTKSIVRPLGEYLSRAFYEDPKKRWRITAYGYEEKINFANQSETLLNGIKVLGVFMLGLLFILFLTTNVMINIRNKASEIAIFRAMGASVLSIIFIFNTQVLMILFIAATTALLLVYVLIPFLRSFFIKYIIESIWTDGNERREAINAILSDQSFDSFISLFSINSSIITSTVICVLIVVSIALIYVRFSPKYAISKILKER